MLDVVVTCYDVEEILLQHKIFKDLNLPFNFHYITNNENKDRVDEIKQSTNLPLYWLDSNPGKHLGALYLASSAIDLISQPYVLHYHADMIFEEPLLIKDMLSSFIDSHKKVAGIPRQWVFNDDGVFQDNKSLPIRSELFFMESDLYKKVFDLNRYDEYRNKCILNNHPSLHFEPYIYAGLELNKVDFNVDFYYLEDVCDMRKMYGDSIIYYNTTFKQTKVKRLK
jgi:hypothetical protein